MGTPISFTSPGANSEWMAHAPTLAPPPPLLTGHTTILATKHYILVILPYPPLPYTPSYTSASPHNGYTLDPLDPTLDPLDLTLDPLDPTKPLWFSALDLTLDPTHLWILLTPDPTHLWILLSSGSSRSGSHPSTATIG
jgi:hypothetical protein